MSKQQELERLTAQYERESKAYPQGKVVQSKLTSLANLEKRIRELQEEIKAGT